MKALIVIIIISTIILITTVTIISPPQANNINTPESEPIKGDKGELCASPTLEIPCEEGLQCLSKDGRANFEPRKTNGYCTNTST